MGSEGIDPEYMIIQLKDTLLLNKFFENSDNSNVFLFLISIVFILKLILNKKNKELFIKDLFLLIFVLLAFIILIRFPILYPVHLNFIYPAIILSIALILGWKINHQRKYKKIILIIIYSVVIIILMVNIFAFLKIIEEIKENKVTLEAKLKIANAISKQKEYGELYVIGMEYLSKEGLTQLVGFNTKKDSLFNEQLNTLIMPKNYLDYKKIKSIYSKEVILPYKKYEIVTFESLLEQKNWKYKQIKEQDWFGLSFNDQSWEVTKLPILICIGINLMDDCENYADFDEVYMKGQFITHEKSNLYLIIQDHQYTHKLSELYINGNNVNIPPPNQFGDIIINISNHTVEGENLLAMHLTLHEDVIQEQARRMEYNLIIMEFE